MPTLDARPNPYDYMDTLRSPLHTAVSSTSLANLPRFDSDLAALQS